MEPGSENRDLDHVEPSPTPKTETDADIAPLIQKVGATSIAQIENLIGELQETKHFSDLEACPARLHLDRCEGFGALNP
jgi:hypothetical protein